MKNCLTQKSKMCDPILVTPFKMRPHYIQSSRENATTSSGTSPLVSYKEVSPPGFFTLYYSTHLTYRWATLEISAKFAMTVTLATRSSQVAVVSRVFVITTPTHRTLATVTSSLGDASLAYSIPLALAVSAANQVTMVTL